jgi:hypothetical protein
LLFTVPTKVRRQSFLKIAFLYHYAPRAPHLLEPMCPGLFIFLSSDSPDTNPSCRAAPASLSLLPRLCAIVTTLSQRTAHQDYAYSPDPDHSAQRYHYQGVK